MCASVCVRDVCVPVDSLIWHVANALHLPHLLATRTRTTLTHVLMIMCRSRRGGGCECSITVDSHAHSYAYTRRTRTSSTRTNRPRNWIAVRIGMSAFSRQTIWMQSNRFIRKPFHAFTHTHTHTERWCAQSFSASRRAEFGTSTSSSCSRAHSDGNNRHTTIVPRASALFLVSTDRFFLFFFCL